MHIVGSFLTQIFLVVFTGPILLFLAILVWVFDGRPIFYSQTRVGLRGKLFTIYKFRTMLVASKTGGYTTIKDDPRITNLGRLLRRSKLDELPQILNVISGDMSLVGPRPTVPEDYEKMNERQKVRLVVRPGITGWAQINGNTALEWPERIELDLYYVNNKNLSLDLLILYRTLLGFIIGRLATDPKSGSEW